MVCWWSGISWRTNWIEMPTPIEPPITQPSDDIYADLPIEPANWQDLGGVMRLEKVCFSADDRWPFFDIAAVLTLPHILRLKIVLDEVLIAFLAVELHNDKKQAWITTIGVEPTYQKHGLASRLLVECEQRVTLPVIRLSVRRSNLGAIGLYRRYGYQQINMWEKYYIGGEDALIFEKVLEV